MIAATGKNVLSIAPTYAGQATNAVEFGLFLMHFRAAFMAAADMVAEQELDPEDIPAVVCRIYDRYQTKPADLPMIYGIMLPVDQDLYFDVLDGGINGLNLRPVMNTWCTSGGSLPLAVAMSGGAPNAEGGYDLPSLSQCIRNLRSLFNVSTDNTFPSDLHKRERN